jgi:hypothetical protein
MCRLFVVCVLWWWFVQWPVCAGLPRLQVSLAERFRARREARRLKMAAMEKEKEKLIEVKAYWTRRHARHRRDKEAADLKRRTYQLEYLRKEKHTKWVEDTAQLTVRRSLLCPSPLSEWDAAPPLNTCALRAV